MNSYGFFDFFEKIFLVAGGIMLVCEQYAIATMFFALSIYCLIKTFED